MPIKEELVKCFRDTIRIINSNNVLLNSTNEAMRCTNLITSNDNISINNNGFSNIFVTENTTLNAAKEYVNLGQKVAVLNFASAVNPGGGVANGAMAQEECLCRSSNLLPCLKQQHLMKDYYMPHRIANNPMYSDKVVYTENVTVFKTDDVLPKIMPSNEWFNIDVITCAAPNLRNVENINEDRLFSIFCKRIDLVFNTALSHNIDTIILGAWGCGAFKNPPETVAKAFKKIIDEKYQTAFNNIVFAIKNSNNNNLEVFKSILDFTPEKVKCDYDKHCFVVNEELTGVTEYICEKCGITTSTIVVPPPECYHNLKQYIGSTIDGKIITKQWFKETLENPDDNSGIKEIADNQSKKKFCYKCGAKIEQNDKFCMKCGAKVIDIETEQPAKDSNDKKCETEADVNDVPEIIDNRYKLIRQIGKGASAIVYLAQDMKLNRVCAVKIVNKNTYSNKMAAQESLDEVNKMKLLAHISIPQLYDIYDDDNRLCIVMEFIEGKNLNDIIKSQKNPFDEYIVVNWAKQLCRVLFYLHTLRPPRIFRDLKPANIILQPNGVIKLIDFGTMKNYDESCTEDTVNLGTKGYAAPEQFGGRGQTDARTDIYCLGMTMYHLMTGINPSLPPFEFRPPRYYRKDISYALERIIMKCIEIERENRYQSAIDLLNDLEKLN